MPADVVAVAESGADKRTDGPDIRPETVTRPSLRFTAALLLFLIFTRAWSPRPPARSDACCFPPNSASAAGAAERMFEIEVCYHAPMDCWSDPAGRVRLPTYPPTYTPYRSLRCCVPNNCEG